MSRVVGAVLTDAPILGVLLSGSRVTTDRKRRFAPDGRGLNGI